MKFHAEGNPVIDKASFQCALFDKYKEILDKNGAKYGVLAQFLPFHQAMDTLSLQTF